MSARYFLAWRWMEEERTRRQHRYLREMNARLRESFDPVEDLSETEFRMRYRLSKDAFLFLCEELRHRTDLKPTQRVSLELKVLTALLFYASGSYQRPVGLAKNISQKTCSRYLEEVTQALIHPNMLSKYIVFPQTALDRRAASQKFYLKYGVPGVVGCIDCSHIKIFQPPAEVEHIYFCRKNYHSLNVQMICDSDLRIVSVNSKFGGSNHDSFIWANSEINYYVQTLHQNHEMVWLLGDSGYPQRPWLMTPFLNFARNSPEALYNDKHKKARVIIENTFGRLKNRWRCLCKDRVLHYKPNKCAQIVQACCVLYNIALDFGVPEPVDDLDQNTPVAAEEVPVEPEAAHDSDLIRGRAYREHLVRRIVSEQ